MHRVHLYNQRAHRDFAIMEAVQQALFITNLTPLQELSMYVPDESAERKEEFSDADEESFSDDLDGEGQEDEEDFYQDDQEWW